MTEAEALAYITRTLAGSSSYGAWLLVGWLVWREIKRSIAAAWMEIRRAYAEHQCRPVVGIRLEGPVRLEQPVQVVQAQSQEAA